MSALELPVGDDRPFPRLRQAVRRTPLHLAYRYGLARLGARAERQMLAGVKTYVLFIGHARSGHSILGALLDAHPQIALSDELDPLRYVSAGFSREQVLWLSVKVARDQAKRLRQKRGRDGRIYSYAVPGQWQGRARELRVVGDSNAGGTVRDLSSHPGLLDRVRRLMDPIDLRFLHVARNPYDNIATMMLRSGRSFDSAFDRYFENWDLIGRLEEEIGAEAVHTVRHESLVGSPRQTVAAAAGFLGIDPGDAYLDACAAVIYDSPSRTRHAVEWSPQQRSMIDGAIATHPALAGYTFEA